MDILQLAPPQESGLVIYFPPASVIPAGDSRFSHVTSTVRQLTPKLQKSLLRHHLNATFWVLEQSEAECYIISLNCFSLPGFNESYQRLLAVPWFYQIRQNGRLQISCVVGKTILFDEAIGFNAQIKLYSFLTHNIYLFIISSSLCIGILNIILNHN